MKKHEFYSRRQMLLLGTRTLAIMSSLWILPNVTRAENLIVNNKRITKITKSDQEWEKELSSQQYDVLREEGTERPFTSSLLKEHRKGVFACAGCGLPLFRSDAKYDSGTGWPSFYQSIEGHVETKTDFKLVAPRTEYHCARCDGHQGHIFEDGPAPTGLRYCNNGVALKFVPEGEEGEDRG
ncbi:MAG: peptide-methionine (R)-S-oxide reductase MsrB [Alphaproteobacteria bacterium]|nr:peptide-methionine (R)-S-oxide reductase MsrB [Alphaproteobacteria bacterium]